MISAQYDIFRKRGTELVWIETSHDLTSAKQRIRALAEESGDHYVVYDQRARQIIASSD